MNKLYAVKSYSFYAGIIVNNNYIVYTAPILSKHIGQSFDKFKEYARKSRWAIIDPVIHTEPKYIPPASPLMRPRRPPRAKKSRSI
jgi:hypothetical protein